MKEVQNSSLVNFSKSNPGQQPEWLCWFPGLPAAGFSSVQLLLALWMCGGPLRLTGSPLPIPEALTAMMHLHIQMHIVLWTCFVIFCHRMCDYLKLNLFL